VSKKYRSLRLITKQTRRHKKVTKSEENLQQLPEILHLITKCCFMKFLLQKSVCVDITYKNEPERVNRDDVSSSFADKKVNYTTSNS
jgi:hypothetical protein